jgi:L-aminopeptidase/D-esterase-like protein
MPRCSSGGAGPGSAPKDEEQGSIIVIVATDAHVLPHQLKRIVTRVSLGIARTGGIGGNSSGDIFIAFSTANPRTATNGGVANVQMMSNARMNGLFYATVQATEEAIVNAMLAATTMTGADDYRVHALPRDRLLTALRKYGR